MCKFVLCFFLFCCFIISVKSTERILEICKNLKPENVTLEEFAGGWIVVEAYLEFGAAYQAMSEEQRNLSTMCETFDTSLAEDVNETLAVGVFNIMDPVYNLTSTTNITFKMLKPGVFTMVNGNFVTVVATNANKDYMTLANCQDNDISNASISLNLVTVRSSTAEYSETSLQQLRVKSQHIFGYDSITPLPYRKDCRLSSSN